MKMKRICVFCGSSSGARPAYVKAVEALARSMGSRGLGMVYGGGGLGLMGAAARAVRAAGGEVIGVIPKDLADKGVGNPDLDDMRVVGSMHERKALMVELSDAFIALPGGFGTLEEILEVLTWGQLGLHKKPCGLLNVEGYYTLLTQLLDHAVGEGFIQTEHRAIAIVEEDPERLLQRFEQYQPPTLDKAVWALRLREAEMQARTAGGEVQPDVPQE